MHMYMCARTCLSYPPVCRRLCNLTCQDGNNAVAKGCLAECVGEELRREASIVVLRNPVGDVTRRDEHGREARDGPGAYAGLVGVHSGTIVRTGRGWTYAACALPHYRSTAVPQYRNPLVRTRTVPARTPPRHTVANDNLHPCFKDSKDERCGEPTEHTFETRHSQGRAAAEDYYVMCTCRVGG